jgi:DNA polymerase-3 subunit alpha
MSEFTNLNDLMFPGLPPVSNERRFATASKTIHNETVPTPSLPDGFTNSNDYLRYLVIEGACNHYGCMTPKDVKERINHELSIIEKKGLADYILFIWDSMRTARESLKSCLVLSLKGRALCSMVNYLLDITSINPIEHHLPFEMFVDETANYIPNISMDVDSDNSNEFINLMEKKYGNQIAPLFFEYKKKTDGQKRRKIHHDQWAIANRDIANVLPMCEVYDEKRSENVLCPIYSKHDRMKIYEKDAMIQSIMNWSPLSTLNRMLNKIKPHSSNADKLRFLKEIPLDDPATMDLFRTGDTEDIYLFDAPDIREHLVNLHPDTLMDLVTLNSLSAPSKRNTPLLQEFLRRKKAGEVIHYPIPEMAEVLDETYGLLLYPEQLMLLAHKLGNFSLSDAYTLSISMGRIVRNHDLVMNHYLPMFIKGGFEKGFPKDLLEQLFTLWWQYGGFAKIFPKCSDMGLVLTSYQLAYLKAHYSKEWTELQILKNIFRR